MEFYTLNRLEYWKYYAMVMYYRFHEMPPVVKFCTVFTTICLLLVLILVIRTFIQGFRLTRSLRRTQEYRDKLCPLVREIVLNPLTLENAEIADRLGIPKNYRMREKIVDLQGPALRELYQENKEGINRVNWHRTLQVLKIPVYFEHQMRSHKMRKRIVALKNIGDLDADLKEAIASRYLFAKDPKLKMHARLHAARYGTSYPFKVLEEDPQLVFTEELMVKYHNILLYRNENGLSMPNFIRWCRRVPVNDDLRVFAVNEIRLFRMRDSCPQLLEMLRDSRDERFSCALIRTLGELAYIPAEAEFRRRYGSASFQERQILAEALGMMNSGNPDVIRFLSYDFEKATDAVSRMKLLRVLYNYGPGGREAYNQLKVNASPENAILFEHIESPLIDSRKYA